MECGRGHPPKELQGGVYVDVEKPGRALNRDLGTSSSEAAEEQIRVFIERRARGLEAETREHYEEEAWAESTRRHNAAREAELREAWCTYHQEQAGRHRAILEALAAHHEKRADELMNGESGARGRV
jgi:selenocysteine-specific translation elongation factor